MLALGGKVQRELHAVKASELLVIEGVDAEAIGRDARPDAAPSEVVENAPVLRVQPVLTDTEVDRAGRHGFAHPPNVKAGELLHHHVRTVAVCATQIAFVGEPDTDRKDSPQSALLCRPTVARARPQMSRGC